VNAPKVLAEQVDGEIILINLESGHYYRLADAGAAVWTVLAQGGDRDDAVAAVAARYAEERSVIAAGVSELVAELTRESLLVPDADGPAPGGDRLDPGSGIGTAPPLRQRPFTAPRLEKYIDMQKLIALDPVLEVDESGWPKPDRT
jgi:hypothetical protein